MALRLYEGVTKDYHETKQEMWNQYWWLKGIGEMRLCLCLKDFISIKRLTHKEVQQFWEQWKWEMVHAMERDPFQPVQVNDDGETVLPPTPTACVEESAVQDWAITNALATIQPLAVATGQFLDRSGMAPPGIMSKPELEPIEDPQEDSRPLEDRYTHQHFEAAFCLWHWKLDSHFKIDLTTCSPHHFNPEYAEYPWLINYIARGITE